MQQQTVVARHLGDRRVVLTAVSSVRSIALHSLASTGETLRHLLFVERASIDVQSVLSCVAVRVAGTVDRVLVRSNRVHAVRSTANRICDRRTASSQSTLQAQNHADFVVLCRHFRAQLGSAQRVLFAARHEMDRRFAEIAIALLLDRS